MKIMHMADLHLDSAFSGFEKERAEEKRQELRECFTKAMQIAKEQGVGLVLIAGDLFDTPFCSLATRKAIFRAIAEVECPVVISPGNHDYYIKNGTYADENLPENAYVFTSNELGRFDFDDMGISVIGYAFTSDRYEENPLASDVPVSSENMNILCAHTELGVPLSKYAPINPNAISLCGFTYAALGHVHAAPEPTRVGKSLIAYSGFAQGRSFDELGDGGAYIIDVDRECGVQEIARIPLSKTVYMIEKLDVSGLADDSDIVRKICDLINARGYGENVALRIRLMGAIASDYDINIRAIKNDESIKKLALLQIKNECVSNFDLDYLKKDITVKGEVYRRLLPMLESADENERQKAALALKLALAALDSREFLAE